MKLKWKKQIETQLAETKLAWDEIRKLSSERKNRFLKRAAQELLRNQSAILRANRKDVAAARQDSLSAAMLDRLTLTPKRIEAIAAGVKAVAGLKDPVGATQASWKRPNGLKISKVSVPIGVILIIYESRPNVTVECAALCFKSGNAAILRGGRESFHTNQALAAVLKKALKLEKLPEAAITLIATTDREAVDFLLKRDKDIHLVIPRGGETLIRKVVELSRIPVIKHYQGICHVYVDKKADFIKAEAIVLNAK
ncbi:MAG: glutamate-5-semialdehyde dehydrogenase, partial [Candidatus Omnitrophica bacterium]|nr:glutamate-5-semialdehyde dehydrogenase [Candidatus Omnitrophota bacterium]